MSDKDFEQFADSTMNLEGALAEFIRQAEKNGLTDRDICERLADAVINASDDRLRVTVNIESE